MRKWLIPAILAVLILANAFPAFAGQKKEKKRARVAPERTEVHKKRVRERLGMLSEEQRQMLRRRLAGSPEAREGFMRRLGTMMPAEWNDLRVRLCDKAAPDRKRMQEGRRARQWDGQRSDRPAMRRGRGMNRGMPGMDQMRRGMPGMQRGMHGHQQMMGKFKGMRTGKMDGRHGKWGKRFKKRKKDGTNRYQRARRFNYGRREME